MAVSKETITKDIAENKVMVFAKTHCPFCKKAIDALEQLKPSGMKILHIEGLPNMDEVQDILKGITGGRTVPRVFIGGKFFGGGDDTVAGVASGSLKNRLVEVGALAA
eukprot:CAMPEP_0113849760 /NCGR_PEP_ID=MMETSP0372-20130328/3370_1 /TAXON_ID=340204 /ORGANISM="Lankesteria abbotti" /LENGTH=107 /DNA_ID=CAMNT_0000819707 /DNA_START=68 /DNA_END=391 /DNA_ORIENTATION=+ /assembly_acc=CAM_ASM_000359